MPPANPNHANAHNGNKLCKNVIAPINGAVSSQMRAHTMHEKMQIFCFDDEINSFVHVTNTVCEQVVDIFDNIARVIPMTTYTISSTAKIETKILPIIDRRYINIDKYKSECASRPK